MTYQSYPPLLLAGTASYETLLLYEAAPRITENWSRRHRAAMVRSHADAGIGHRGSRCNPGVGRSDLRDRGTGWGKALYE
jgi:hypothetical protein